MKLVPEKL